MTREEWRDLQAGDVLRLDDKAPVTFKSWGDERRSWFRCREGRGWGGARLNDWTLISKADPSPRVELRIVYGGGM